MQVLDLERLSKNCSICTGLLSVKHSDPKKYSEIKNKHKCEANHTGSSGRFSSKIFLANYSFFKVLWRSMEYIVYLPAPRDCTRFNIQSK